MCIRDRFKVTSPQIVCLSGPPLTLFIENPDAVYDYVWTAPNGDESFGEQITIEFGGVYTVTATTTNGTDSLSSPYTNTTANQQTIYVLVENKDTWCVNDDFTFDVIVNPLPKFTVTSPQIVCLSCPPLTLFIENPDAVYDYVWTAPNGCLLYTSPSPRDRTRSRMPSSA